MTAGDPDILEGLPTGDRDEDRLLIMISRLKRARIDRRLSLRKLAEDMKVDFTHLSRVERGKAYPGMVILLRWCRALSIDYQTLFSESDPGSA
jgi:transcriptional regulator with XRE-family HTH domain